MLAGGNGGGDTWGLMQTAFGRACLNAGRFEECLRRLEQGLPALAGDPSEAASTHGAMALACGFLGRFADGHRHAERALALTEPLHNAQRLGTMLVLDQMMLTIEGNWEEVKRIGDAGAAKMGIDAENLLYLIGMREVVCGYADFMLGWIEAGQGLIQRGVQHMAETKLLLSRTLCSAWLAETSALIGLTEQAAAAAAFAFAGEQRGDHYAEVVAHRALGIAAAAAGDSAEMEAHFQRSLELAATRGEQPHAAICRFRMAECLSQAGRASAARDALAQALQGFAELNMSAWSEMAQRLAV
jgi:tetratricopeptide (TPR) repeat protein